MCRRTRAPKTAPRVSLRADCDDGGQAAEISGNQRSRKHTESNRADRESRLDSLDEAARARFERLRALRLELARKQGWRAFRIVSDRILCEIARLSPSSMPELLAINGIGPHKAKEYGQVFLDALAAESKPGHQGIQPDPAIADRNDIAERDEPGLNESRRYERLRAVRLYLAEQSGWPAYRVLTDTVLRDVARLAPATIEQLNGIVGEAKAKKYGQQLLSAMSAVDH